MGKVWKQGILASLVGLISVFLMTYSTVTLYKMNGQEIESNIVFDIFIRAGLIVFILTFISWVVGKTLSRKMGFNTEFTIEKKNLINILLVSTVLSLVILILDKFLFERLVPEFQIVSNLLSTNLYIVLYSGFIEEVWFRLAGVTFFSYAIHNVVFKGAEQKRKLSVSLSITLMVIIFFMVNLLEVQQVYHLVDIVIIRSVLIYIVPSVIYSLIYYKKGFVYSVICHMFTIILANFILIPIIVNL